MNYANDRAGAEQVVAAIVAAGGKAVAIQGDVAKAADVQRLFDETERSLGTPSVLVNNAGVFAFEPQVAARISLRACKLCPRAGWSEHKAHHAGEVRAAVPSASGEHRRLADLRKPLTDDMVGEVPLGSGQYERR